MALEHWRACAVSKDGKRMCRIAAEWDTRQKKVVNQYIEGYGVPEGEYKQWRSQLPPLKVERTC